MHLSSFFYLSRNTHIMFSVSSIGYVTHGIPIIYGTGDSINYDILSGSIGILTLHHLSGRNNACSPSQHDVIAFRSYETNIIDCSYIAAQKRKYRSGREIREKRIGQNHSMSQQHILGAYVSLKLVDSKLIFIIKESTGFTQ